MRFYVDMQQFKERWVWDTDTTHFGNNIAWSKGSFLTLQGDSYKRLLTK